MTVVHVYSVAMKTLCVQIRGNDKTVKLLADKAEENTDSNELLAYSGSEVIGRFNMKDLVGWWLEA